MIMDMCDRKRTPDTAILQAKKPGTSMTFRANMQVNLIDFGEVVRCGDERQIQDRSVVLLRKGLSLPNGVADRRLSGI